MRLCTCGLIASLLVASPALAQAGKKKGPAPNEVEVRLADGSRVRMTILQDSLEMVTKFGKLTVPTIDIRRIEFGIRPPEAVAKKIDDAIKRLGGESFKEREAAATELVAVGAPAYIALYRASKSTDLEVAQRSKAALERVRQKVPENQLRVRDDDMIQTAEFTMVGRISTPTIKANTAIFGEAQLKVTDLRAIRWLGCMAEVEISVDASKYATGSTWMDTGVELSLEDEMVLAASGQVDLNPGNGGQFLTGPNGTNQWGGRGGNASHMPGALLGRIGDNGPVFVVGENYKGTAKREGKLFLQIVPSPWFGNGMISSGAYKVNITGGRDTSDR
jgi:hypothetical protein